MSILTSLYSCARAVWGTYVDACLLSGYETASGSSPKPPISPLGSSATIISVRARCAGRGVPCISTQFHESQAIAIHVDSALTVILQPERQIDPQSEFQSSDSLAMHFNRYDMGALGR